MESKSWRKLFVSFLLLFVPLASAQLPYNAVHLLQSPQNGSLVFAFRPSEDGSEVFQLHKIDVSSSLDLSNIEYSTITSSLPFIDSDVPNAFLPVISSDGRIAVYSGRCDGGPERAELWTLSWADKETMETGNWVKQSLSVEPTEDDTVLAGANFLASAISFSSSASEDDHNAALYSFGGMCPSGDSTLDTWQSAADYSNLLVVIQSDGDTESSDHSLGLASNRGAPIAEAGFSITPLQPLFSNNSDGPKVQQQDFVLIGGHTESAFINTSQVALFSLPQENWSFLPIEQPDSERTDLTVRDDITEIEPRSGHTAILSEDGKSIVLFGGWIGDVNTPASPQLAILTLGDGYGGEGSWSWSAPKQTEFSPSGGIYGHGAVMLPGNIMWIVGGYSISDAQSKLRSRATSLNSQSFLYNVTAGSWVNEYTAPNPENDGPQENSGPLSTTQQKIGLGAGLGIGAAAILCLFIGYLLYNRRLKKIRESREDDLKKLALDAQRYYPSDLGRPSVDGRGGDMYAAYGQGDSSAQPQNRGNSQQGWKQVQGRDAERTGLLVEIPSPTRGLRRSLHGRPQSQITFDNRRTHGTGGIHPIDEQEEEEDPTPLSPEGISSPETQEMAEVKGHKRFSTSIVSTTYSIPPDTNPLGSHPVQGESSRQPRDGRSGTETHSRHRSLDLISWVNDWQQTADALLLSGHGSSSSSGGRVSPSKSDRTESNLSERSVRSLISSRSGGTGNARRSMSLRSATLLHNVVNPFATPEPSPTSEHPPPSSTDSESPRNQSMNSNVIRPGTRENDGDSFSTARTSFAQLQAEGEALLGGRHSTHINFPDSRPRSEATFYDRDDHNPARGRGRGWMGSVRRVLGRGRADSARRISLTADESLTYINDSSSSSPTKPESPAKTPGTFNVLKPKPGPPRRAASDAAYLQAMRGARDWGVVSAEGEPSSASETAFPRSWQRRSGDDWGSPEDRERLELDEKRAGEDWDVESAAERRVVQVVYTVPKQRLRVVNADEQAASRQGSSEDLQTASTKISVEDKGKRRVEE